MSNHVRAVMFPLRYTRGRAWHKEESVCVCGGGGGGGGAVGRDGMG